MKLLTIKLVHTFIWAFMASCVLYIFSAGMLGFINGYVHIAIAVIFLEGLILLIFKWRCPFTIIAQNYTQNREENFDIFLPRLLAKHNKNIFTTLFVIGLVLILLRKNL